MEKTSGRSVLLKKNAWFLFIKLLIITSASAHDQTF